MQDGGWCGILPGHEQLAAIALISMLLRYKLSMRQIWKVCAGVGKSRLTVGMLLDFLFSKQQPKMFKHVLLQFTHEKLQKRDQCYFEKSLYAEQKATITFFTSKEMALPAKMPDDVNLEDILLIVDESDVALLDNPVSAKEFMDGQGKKLGGIVCFTATPASTDICDSENVLDHCQAFCQTLGFRFYLFREEDQTDQEVIDSVVHYFAEGSNTTYERIQDFVDKNSEVSPVLIFVDDNLDLQR